MEGTEEQEKPVPRKSKPLVREAESLGWLAQSAVQPKKRREIDGVSVNSIVDLKAQLYRTQEQARLRADGMIGPEDLQARRKAGLDVTLLSRKNAGVEERSRRDEAELQRSSDRVAECYAALERKAKLYEQLVRGEAPDNEDTYNVDFLQKHTLEQEAELLRPQPSSFLGGAEEEPEAADLERAEGTGDGAMELPGGPAPEPDAPEDEDSARRRQRKQVISELARETDEARGRAEELKRQRAQQQEERRMRLKMEFLKRQAAKLRAADGQKPPPQP
uniref:Cytochrome b561 ferric reductase transmembrane family protein n=1 Tax=Tetraselmis sp. GSL018 TaxID=582737 RepID=A0A061QJ86_9CHLO|mmetsp:Transcript_257/g.509  ORF Transcript_257/g.509 Transcript_257/m.509 type:complete len:276 (-) Transcript_257:1317-2144(-)